MPRLLEGEEHWVRARIFSNENLAYKPPHRRTVIGIAILVLLREFGFYGFFFVIPRVFFSSVVTFSFRTQMLLTSYKSQNHHLNVR